MFATQVGLLINGFKMHIPDGFLSVLVSVVFWGLSIVVVGVALWRTGKELDERKVPLMGVLGAAIFAGQMLNFSVTGGTSGHLMGAALAAILLGPWPAILVMTSVVSIQALLFQDGGLLALGANVFNMAVVGVFVAYGCYRTFLTLTEGKRWAPLAGGFVAAWVSIVVASLVAALQLALSGTLAADVAVPAMGLVHMLIGVGEGLITIGALALLRATRPDLIPGVGRETAQGGSQVVWIGGMLIAIVLAFLSPLASTHPDGLEWVAERTGFAAKALDAPFKIIPDYVFPGLPDETVATIAAGIVGAILVGAVALGVGYLRHRRALERLS